MPGLQTLVSTWIKVNQGHVEYFGEELAHATQQQQQQHSQPSQASGGPSGQAGQVDPRSAAAHSQQQQQQQQQQQHGYSTTLPPSFPSSSSLSSYSFSKNGTIMHQPHHPPGRAAITPTSSLSSHRLMGEPPTSLSAGPLPSSSSNTAGVLSNSSSSSSTFMGSSSQQHQQHHHQPLHHDPYARHSRASTRATSRSSTSTLASNNQNHHQHQFQQSNHLLQNTNNNNTSGQYLNNNNHHRHHHQNLSQQQQQQQQQQQNHHHHQHHPQHHHPHQLNTNNYIDSFPPPQAGADAILGRRKSLDRTYSTMLTREMSSTLTETSLVDGNTGNTNNNINNTNTNNNTDANNSTTMVETKKNDGRRNSDNNNNNNNNNMSSSIGPHSRNISSNSLNRTIRKHTRQKLRKSHSRTDLVREMSLDRNYARNTGALSSLSAAGASAVGGGGGGSSELDLSVSSSTGSMAWTTTTTNPTGRRSSILSQLPVTEEEGAGHSTSLGSGAGESPKFDGGITPPLSQLTSSFRKTSLESNSNTEQSIYSGGGASEITHQASGGGGQWMQGGFPNQPHGSRSTSLRHSSMTTSVSSAGSMNGVAGTTSTKDGSMLFGASHGAALAAAAMARKHDFNPDQSKGATNSTSPSTPNAMGSLSDCNRCAQMECTLLALQADLEYLRTLELQKEFVCKECDSGSVNRPSTRARQPSHQPLLNNLSEPSPPSAAQNPLYPNTSSGQSVASVASIGSRGSLSSRLRPKRRSGTNTIGTRNQAQPSNSTNIGSRTAMFLRDASKRLSELSTRHKRQVKQSTHERAYWQNDMHLKLEKFAMMCKNLNEEAAFRSNEVKETKQLLEKMTLDRNSLNSQVETLKARVTLYEGESVEQARLREKFEKEELQMLDAIEKAVKDRDETIDDLASRLDLAVETIETERRQQRMRRQIIFPSSRSSSSNISGDLLNAPSSPHHRPSVSADPTKDDLERIQKAKEVAKKAQLSLQTAMFQSAERERALQKRLNAMERELALSRMKSGEEPLCIAEGISLTRATSTSSL